MMMRGKSLPPEHYNIHLIENYKYNQLHVSLTHERTTYFLQRKRTGGALLDPPVPFRYLSTDFDEIDTI